MDFEDSELKSLCEVVFVRTLVRDDTFLGESDSTVSFSFSGMSLFEALRGTVGVAVVTVTAGVVDGAESDLGIKT